MDPKGTQPQTQAEPAAPQTLVPPSTPVVEAQPSVQPQVPSAPVPTGSSGKGSPIVKIAIALLIFAGLAIGGYFLGTMFAGKGEGTESLPRVTLKPRVTPTSSPSESPEATGSATPKSSPSTSPKATSSAKPSATPQ